MHIRTLGLGLAGFAGALLLSNAAAAQNVSYTDAQATRGAQLFNDNCMRCHGAGARGGQGPALVGAQFDDDWRGKPAAAMYEYMSNNMPYDEPGTLDKDIYVNVLAWVLKMNGVPAGGQPLVQNPPGIIPRR